MAHRTKEVDRRSLFGLLAAVHDDDAVRAPGDDTHVVRNQEDAHLEFFT